MAGRIGSIITQLYLPPDKKAHQTLYEYCSFCGTCAKQCPANSISIEEGKDQSKCSAFLNIIGEKYHLRYACGKGQVSVPCESRIPAKIDK